MLAISEGKMENKVDNQRDRRRHGGKKRGREEEGGRERECVLNCLGFGTWNKKVHGLKAW